MILHMYLLIPNVPDLSFFNDNQLDSSFGLMSFRFHLHPLHRLPKQICNKYQTNTELMRGLTPLKINMEEHSHGDLRDHFPFKMVDL